MKQRNKPFCRRENGKIIMLNCIVENQLNNDPFLLDNVDNLIKSYMKWVTAVCRLRRISIVLSTRSQKDVERKKRTLKWIILRKSNQNSNLIFFRFESASGLRVLRRSVPPWSVYFIKIENGKLRQMTRNTTLGNLVKWTVKSISSWKIKIVKENFTSSLRRWNVMENNNDYWYATEYQEINFCP